MCEQQTTQDIEDYHVMLMSGISDMENEDLGI
jgi:hypothetical protein